MPLKSTLLYSRLAEVMRDEFPHGSKGLLFADQQDGYVRGTGVGVRRDRVTGGVYVNADILFRWVELEEVNVRIWPKKALLRLHQTSTLGKQIGYLEPRNSFHEWLVEDETEVEEVLMDMRRSILRYGPRLWDKFRTREDVFNEIETGGEFASLARRPYQLPLVYGLTDRKEEAIVLLTKTAASMKHPIYDEFVRNWFAYFMPGTKSPV